MKLIDLLKIELPKRGGWPEGAHGVVQDNSGQVWFYKNGNPYFTGILWGADPVSHDFDWVSFDLRIEMSDDCATAIVTREQYEAAQQPVWDGEGLPPVGTECEIRKIAEWMKVNISFISEVHTVFKTPGGTEECQKTCNLQFRPIRTKADRKREASIAAMHEFFGHVSGLYDLSGFYDEIAAGKIPGVEISK